MIRMLVLEIIIVYVYFFKENNKTHAHVHTHTHTHTRTHARTHAYTHTYLIQVYMFSF